MLSANCSPRKPLTNRPPRISAAIFEAAESDEQLAPFGKIGFAREKFAEDDSVAAQKHPAGGFECARTIVNLAGEE